MMRLAKKVTKQSNHHTYKMGATIVKGGRILVSKSNQINRGCHFIKIKKWENTLHAEAHAILHLLKHNRLHHLAGASLYVTRVNTKGSVMLAKPCKHCQSLAESVGIKEIFYTTNQGTTEVIRL